MHELSIAMSLVETACEKAHALGGVRVSALHVRVGALSGVVKDALLFSFEVAAQGTPLEGARLLVTEVPLAIRCLRCDDEREVTEFRLVCPVCDEPASQVLRGRELELTALEVEDE